FIVGGSQIPPSADVVPFKITELLTDCRCLGRSGLHVSLFRRFHLLKRASARLYLSCKRLTTQVLPDASLPGCAWGYTTALSHTASWPLRFRKLLPFV